MKYFIVALLSLFTFCSCSAGSYKKDIRTLDDFNSLAGKPLNDKFSNLQSVKVVYDYGSGKLYFVNSLQFRYHHDFCKEILRFHGDLSAFNAVSYNASDNRKYLLCNLNYLKAADEWIMELAASDLMNERMIAKLYDVLQQHVYFKPRLHFYLNTPRLIALKEQGKIRVPAVYADFIFKNITEQSVEQGIAVGILKKYDVANDPASFHPENNEIIVINATPVSIPDVKGIIVTELQTPLSHLVLLAKNRNIPVYVNTQIWKDEQVNDLLNDKVELSVFAERYTLQKTGKAITAKPQVPLLHLKKDTVFTGLVDLGKPLPAQPQGIIGTKATNLALLISIARELKQFRAPEHAFAIPFYYYEQFIKDNHLQESIDALLTLPADSTSAISAGLKSLRTKIKSLHVSKELLSLVSDRIEAQDEFADFKFRSSTNAEDLDDFNGAGLYDSKSAKKGNPDKTVEKAILEVWSSLWNERAFREREIFNIDHRSCAMAILVHRSFPDEAANGVLISTNLYRKEYQGITVNVQKGEASVVAPDPGITCDEFYCHNFNYNSNKISIDYRSTSSINGQKPVLSEQEITKLFYLVPKIENRIHRLWRQYGMSKKILPLDLEFKIVGSERQLYIKQVRPYRD